MITPTFPKNGEIWFVNIPDQPNDPHQQRSAVIVSTNGRNRAASDVIVVPTTSSTGFQPHPAVHVELPAGVGGLPRDSYARADQITTLDKSLLSNGPLGEEIHVSYRWKIIRAIRRAIGDTTA
jgi:mRNA-degrading endonuclease toxin of MazEF toxin-antitoxin module